MIQVVGYIRRSTDKQEMSLEQQRAKLEQFASARGWKLVQVFSDDAISGSDMKRPGLESLLAFARSSKDVHAVIAWERNRLARPKDPLDGMMLERELMANGKQVFYVATGQQADRSFTSGLLGYIEHHQSGDYLRKLSRDVTRGIVHRVERGLWPGGPIPFGFDRLILAPDGKPKRIVRDMPDRSQLVLDAATGAVLEKYSGEHRYSKQDFELCTLIPSEPARVQAVQKIFADYAAGAPFRVIRDALNRSGLRTARGRIFTLPTLHAMLENRAYLGECVYNRRTESKWHRLTQGQTVERTDEGLELRPESDWIIKRDAWAAIVDADTFQKVQARRKDSRERNLHVCGHAIHSEYILGGLMYCGVCGGRLVGYTCKSGKGYRTRYYICSTHHQGDHERCAKRYRIPADLLERHIIDLIKADLQRLQNSVTLRQYIAEELQRLAGASEGKGERLQQRLAHLDQQLAKVREHLKALDGETAQSLGLYEEAKAIVEERKVIEAELQTSGEKLPELPELSVLVERAMAAFGELEKVLAGATIEEKRELIGLYVQTIKADPDSHSVQIGLYPTLFTRKVAGGGFDGRNRSVIVAFRYR